MPPVDSQTKDTNMAVKARNFADMLVNSDEVPKARRGRVAQINPTLVDALSVVTAGKSLNLSDGGAELFSATTDKAEQGKVGQKIRTHWKAIHGDTSKPSVRWTTEGKVFVSIAAAK